LRADKHRRIRHAFEIRHDSFIDERFFGLLRKHKAAFVVADTAGEWPYAEELTADFVYVRLHGASELYTSSYSDRELDRWARLIRRWKCDAYVYFDNDRKVKAPFDAMRLAERLGLQVNETVMRSAA
jgi:uncharacterized protein YecE (DUF72 family)